MSLKTFMVSLQLLSRVSNKHSCMSPHIKNKDEKSKEGVLKMEHNIYTKIFAVIFLLASEGEKARVWGLSSICQISSRSLFISSNTSLEMSTFSSPQRPCRLLGMGSPGQPPWISNSFWALKCQLQAVWEDLQKQSKSTSSYSFCVFLFFFSSLFFPLSCGTFFFLDNKNNH